MTLLAVYILLIFASSVMFYAETKAQPEAFPSIRAARWWGLVALTTVGYGNIYPVTVIGKLFGAVLAFIGIGLFVLPAGIIASGFTTEVENTKEEENHESVATTLTPCLARKQRTSQQEKLIEGDVEQRVQLRSICIEAARQKLGSRFEDEAIIRDIATSLYLETLHKFNL